MFTAPRPNSRPRSLHINHSSRSLLHRQPTFSAPFPLHILGFSHSHVSGCAGRGFALQPGRGGRHLFRFTMQTGE